VRKARPSIIKLAVAELVNSELAATDPNVQRLTGDGRADPVERAETLTDKMHPRLPHADPKRQCVVTSIRLESLLIRLIGAPQPFDEGFTEVIASELRG